MGLFNIDDGRWYAWKATGSDAGPTLEIYADTADNWRRTFDGGLVGYVYTETAKDAVMPYRYTLWSHGTLLGEGRCGTASAARSEAGQCAELAGERIRDAIRALDIRSTR